jgi:hypothetical protein
MAEVEAGAAAPETPTETPAPDQPSTPAPEAPKSPARTYSQDEVDRIAQRVRKNARYLGRKEAEAEFGTRGTTKPAEPTDGQPDTPKQDPDPEPKREAFDTYEDYQRAVARWEGRKAAREEREKDQKQTKERTEAEAREKRARTFRSRAEEAMKAIPDFAETIENAQDVFISAAMAEAIEESEIGPRILYEIVKNPKEAERIAGLSVASQGREIGKIEARLEAALKKPAKQDPEKDDKPGEQEGDDKAPVTDRNPDGTFKPKKEPSQAPEPIEPVGGRGGPASDVPSEKDDMKTWMRKRQKQVHRR